MKTSLMSRLTGALMGALMLSTCAAPALAAQRITFDPGGSIIAFIVKYNDWRVTNERVVIDGMCISACTMITGLLDVRNVCVTPFARLAFHSAYSSDTGAFHREATRLIWNIYPTHVRELLQRRGWQEGMEHPDLLYVEGAELRTIFRDCTHADMLAVNATVTKSK